MTVTAPLPACFLMVAQVASSGFQVLAAACSEVSSGSLLVFEMQRGSISPTLIRSPFEIKWSPIEVSAKVISICQDWAFAEGSRHKNVGADMSGGNTELV